MPSLGRRFLRTLAFLASLVLTTGVAEAASRKAAPVQLDPERPLFVTVIDQDLWWAELISSALLIAKYPGAVIYAPRESLIPAGSQRLDVTPLSSAANRLGSISPTFEIAFSAIYTTGDGSAPVNLGSFRSKLVHSGGRSDTSRLDTDTTNKVMRDFAARVWKRPKAEKPPKK